MFSYYIMKTYIGIYKIPAIWDRLPKEKFLKKDKIDFVLSNNVKEINEHKYRITNTKNNIYFELFKNSIKNVKCDIYHYIFIDESIKKNIKTKIDDINVWILKNHEDLCYFMNKDAYFLRGNYLNYYNNFIKNDCYILFYPATSICFNYKWKKTGKIVKRGEKFKLKDIFKYSTKNFPENHNFYKKISIVYVHEDKEYNRIYKETKQTELLYKPACSIFKKIETSKIYDFIFIADATQSTKNHDLMFSFINYCELKKMKIKFLYISDLNILKKKYKNFIDDNELVYVNLKYDNYLTPNEMCKYMNKSKNNLIFSGRDAYPRTISETLECGCFNIILDTLSDGKYAINEKNGIILGNKNWELILKEKNSLSYVSNDEIWGNILLHCK